jgi:hypothetical protein
MSQIPIFSYKQYLDDMMRLKDHGHVDADAQVQRPISAGSRGLRRIKKFVKDPVHLMGEEMEGPRPSPANPNPKLFSENKEKITKNEAIKAVLKGISYYKSSGELILPEAIQGNLRTWFEFRWKAIAKSAKK